MARPTVIQNETILDAARAVFLERGVLATSAEVAQRAGVSEGSIFKRFRTKADLFRAAMGLDVGEFPEIVTDLPGRVGQGTVEDNLLGVGVAVIEHFERTMPIMMMSWSNPKLNDCIPSSLDVPDPPPLRAQRLLAEYIAGEIALGRMKPLDPAVIARAFFGALSGHVFSEMLARRRGGLQIDREHFAATYVRALLEGALTTPTSDASERALRPKPQRSAARRAESGPSAGPLEALMARDDRP